MRNYARFIAKVSTLKSVQVLKFLSLHQQAAAAAPLVGSPHRSESQVKVDAYAGGQVEKKSKIRQPFFQNPHSPAEARCHHPQATPFFFSRQAKSKNHQQ
jgi:hypothetical protein